MNDSYLASLQESNENFWRERNGEPRQNSALMALIESLSVALASLK